MSKFKALLIEAEDALRAVGAELANMPEGQLSGSVEELTYSAEDECFCVVYVVENDKVTPEFDEFKRVLFVWTRENGAVRVETAEFALIRKVLDLSREIPMLMENINEAGQ